jgi:hypothetical protein
MSVNYNSFGAFSEADDDVMTDYRIDEDNWSEGDDDSFAEGDDDSAEGDDDSAEFIGGLLSKGIGSALNAVNRIVRPTIKGASRLNIPVPNPAAAVTNGISAVSNLVGRITSPSGKQVQFQLPKTTATKEDIAVLKRAVDANSKAIRINTTAIKKEAEALVTLRKEVKEIDAKHIAATKEQNKIMDAINGRVTKLRKDLDKTKQDAQTQSMFSLLMPPKLKSVRFDGNGNVQAGAEVNVSDSRFDDSNMLLMLALSGGFGGSGSDSNNLLPLILLMKR